MKALVIGATGATGKDLVETLANDTSYTEVVLFVRRLSGNKHPKITEVLTDFNNPGSVSDIVRGDVLFCCLGTTLQAAGSKEKQWEIDYEIPARFAEIASKNKVSSVVLLSAYAANPSSNVFYSSMKGKLEEHFRKLSFERLIIFRPGLLLRKDTDRWGEKASAAVLKIVNAVGLFSKFRPMPTKVLAEKMAKAPKTLSSGEQIVSLQHIFDY
ncbi:NAD(P)H-binding protein [Flavobacterium sp. MAH-1]|uniref:NAD(P)H-binding protein n=1 Tax=Flavobacterium agri TaxID=2743471 RepID=A0A7Y8Y0J8_9FLAO|nr:NAD(P)H-binding protein [Flavobacterium agri]NUY80351.1 NAD(P)H-binding protein [Flavobacterium agri]NYA70376.1 NAD(P)H-binding protein [Flavobacterium agri]